MERTQDIAYAQHLSRRRAIPLTFLYTFPWWALILLIAGILVGILIFTDTTEGGYANIFGYLRDGVSMTLGISFISYTVALIIGLVIGLIRANPPKLAYGFWGNVIGLLRVVLYNLATLYVSIIRGIPVLVWLLIIAFVFTPAFREFIQATFGVRLEMRGTSPTSAIIALATAYGAFMSETFRAGIQSIEKGQIEAARSLGMNYLQVMRLVVLPQAVRRILPPLGNDLVAMIKDSSLVAILGINDITQLAKLRSSTNFRFFDTYLVAAYIYLTMTIIGSILVRWMERRLQTASR
jgi:polar amino acid transport system permease protein